jgi:hypothetical protein
MFKVPAVILYMIIAFNITAFSVVLQLDMLIIDSVTAKVISWAVTIAAWYLAYVKRNKVLFTFGANSNKTRQ